MARRKLLALLAYMALSNRPYGRAELATLLWPDLEEQKGLAVLRSTLWEGSQLLGKDWLEADRKEVRLRPGAHLWVDVSRFEQLVEEARSRSSQREAHATVLPLLTEAASLYRGDFLEGFSLRDTEVFDEWRILQAERLRNRMTALLEQLVHLHLEQGQPTQALACAQRLVALEPTHEPAHRHLMRLYAQSGQRTKALEQYASCVRILSEQLAVMPEEETRRLQESIRACPLPPQAPRSAEGLPSPRLPAELPAPTTALIGRVSELALISQRLAADGCRLLTLVGPGGVGKTSLALEAARAYSTLHGGGAHLVSLAGVDEPGLLASAIADALALPAAPSDTPEALEARLLEHLRSRPLLLVLDNFEHLLGATPLVARLLAHAPGLRLLVTSRERLDLRGEWELALEGLPAGGSEAVELFVRAATQTDASFSLTPDGAACVTRLCQRLGGMPLGIELAAAWVRLMPLEEIASRIEEDLDFLAGPRDAPERQRGMRATFAYSWRLLSAAEQGALRRLSVFRGSFTRGAAQEVAGASLELLASLMRKFLVRRTAAGRHVLHELIRQYAAEQLHALPEEDVRTRELHAAWYAARLEAYRPALEGPEARTALAALEPEWDNVRAAWAHAVEHGRLAVLQQALDGFCLVHELRGHRAEVSEALRRALSRVRQVSSASAPDAREPRLLLGRLLARLGRLCLEGETQREAAGLLAESQGVLSPLDVPGELRFTLEAAGRLALLQGDHCAALWCFRGCLALSKTLEDRRGVAHSLGELAAVAMSQGDAGAARRLLEKSLDASRALGDERQVATGLGRLGHLLAQEGDLEGAHRAYHDGLRLLEALEEPQRTAELLGSLARVLCLRGDLDGAWRCCERQLRLGRELEHPELQARALLGLGRVACQREEGAEARRLCEEGLALYRKLNARQGITESLICLGRIASAAGEPERARGHFHAALEMGMEVGATPQVLEALVGLAELLAPAALAPRTQRALRLISTHPAAERSTREQVARLLTPGEAPGGQLPPARPTPELSALVADVLGTPP
ncbi:MAG TPA: BTAD domain-containing putative transcriptional regulator [Archangium sp.]|uniref:ATP-binding protein n=1 Tax=Archangium sp. TaxID=1872627 RepID=UPI002E35CCF7|nr:BTAD domain-containing putative transcriptional regulator [Archangium sp.]HEX5750156.1 BTAD domain-containing putative transcriptional regulator [Archangium sp.]